MLQDLPDYKYDNNFKIINPTVNDYVVFLNGDLVLCDENYVLPKYQETFGSYKYQYLFSMNDTKFFYCEKENFIFDNFEYKKYDHHNQLCEKWLNFSNITAIQFSKWHRDNKYCSRCGKPLKQSDKERMYYCDDCHIMIYPRINPAIIIGVIDKQNDKILATYRTKSSKSYSLISGFCEVGETLEETCKREVFEEAGVHIKNIRYYKSQPWSFSDSLLMGFVCELDGDNTLSIDYNENAGAFWLSRQEVGVANSDMSLTREILDEFGKGNI